jgi:hypothetical protein
MAAGRQAAASRARPSSARWAQAPRLRAQALFEIADRLEARRTRSPI